MQSRLQNIARSSCYTIKTMTQIIELDHYLTLLINSWHAPFWDSFFFDYSKVWVWFPFYFSFLFIVYKQDKKQTWVFVVSLLLCYLIANHVSSDIIKPLVARFRPTHDPVLADAIHVVNGYRGGRFGFVSSHAANSMGLAIFLSMIVRNRMNTVMLVIWALLTSYSRMYLGVHFLGDILGGMLLGTLAALLSYKLFVYLKRSVYGQGSEAALLLDFSDSQIRIPTLVYIVTCAVMLAVSV